MGFLDYLDNYEKQLDEEVVEEVVVESIVKKSPIAKKKIKKKFIKKPIVKKVIEREVVQEQFDYAADHASDILEGVVDNSSIQQQVSKFQNVNVESLNMDVVSDHASAIL